MNIPNYIELISVAINDYLLVMLELKLQQPFKMTDPKALTVQGEPFVIVKTLFHNAVFKNSGLRKVFFENLNLLNIAIPKFQFQIGQNISFIPIFTAK